MQGNRDVHRRPLINILPVELLSEIFVIVAWMARQTATPTGWMQVLLVCKLWNDVASDIAELWRVIYVNSNQDWLRLCLARAPRCLVDLHFVNVSSRDIHSAKHLILPHKDRIRAIRIIDSHNRLTNGIVDLFTVGLPALGEISFVPVEWRVKRETSFALSAEAFPRIRSLALSGISIPRDPAFYKNIRYLELHENCCKDTGFTIRDLLHALHAASLTLEYLDLSRFDPIQEPRPIERPQFHLRNLRSFRVDNTFKLASQILKHVWIPPNAYLQLRIAVSGGEAVEHRTTDRLLAAIIPPNIRVTLDQAEDLTVLIEQRRFCVQVFDTIPPSPFPSRLAQVIRRSERVRVELLGPHAPEEALCTVPQVCASAKLTTLSIRSPDVRHDFRNWGIVLDAFPLLENLGVQGSQRHERWNAYAGIVFTALMREAAPAAATNGVVRCPSLKAICVEGSLPSVLLSPEESRRFLDLIVASLRTREGHARKLETLTMRSFLRNEAYGELEELVDKVEIVP